jgi:2-amino-4-hydroxy-6-hydroxymethyldihydropteridine diphosphokinase
MEAESARMVRPGEGTVNLRGGDRSAASGWIVVALGSNLGDRETHLERARRGLFAGGFRWVLASPVEETAPLPGSAPGQGAYLNQLLAARRGEVPLDPEGLLALGQALEQAAGRRRAEEPHWGPRPLDVDIVLFGDRVIDAPGLVVPHPRLSERPFVVGPLVGWWPGITDPRTGAPLGTKGLV